MDNTGTASTTTHGGLRTPRRTAVTTLAAELPDPTVTELHASCDPWHYPDYTGSQIVPGLFQGGTEDDDVLVRCQAGVAA